MIFPQTTLNCAGTLLDLSVPQVMGIINLTPDSFYASSRKQGTDNALAAAEQMLEEGAAILDLGGMSSRPGAEIISVEEELRRVIAPITTIKKHFPKALISIDTVHARVAKEAVQAGAAVVNDISAGSIDPEMYSTVADLQVPYILMHMQGTPKTMQLAPQYDDVLQEVLDFFIQEIDQLRSLGLHDIVIDPGFGFGKTIEQNYQLLANMHAFRILEVPILAGVSRKSMIYKLLNTKAEEALHGSTAAHVVALQQGARILRVHDVQAAFDAVRVWEQIEKFSR
ncbi:MAG: dihydropteroate synthase [Bacteroidota bacterium]